MPYQPLSLNILGDKTKAYNISRTLMYGSFAASLVIYALEPENKYLWVWMMWVVCFGCLLWIMLSTYRPSVGTMTFNQDLSITISGQNAKKLYNIKTIQLNLHSVKAKRILPRKFEGVDNEICIYEQTNEHRMIVAIKHSEVAPINALFEAWIRQGVVILLRNVRGEEIRVYNTSSFLMYIS